MNEFGSKFDWDSSSAFLGGSGLQFDGARWYRSGRDALRALVCGCGELPSRVLLPALCCESMILPFSQCGVDLAFYRMTPELNADRDDLLSKLRDGAMLIYMRYFGIRPFEDAFLAELRERYKGLRLVEDRTHDVILPRRGGDCRPDAMLASVRKWAALPEGALLVTGAETPEGESDRRFGDMQRAAMEMKSRFLHGSAEDRPEDYLELFRRSEELLDDNTEPRLICDEYLSLISSMDFESILSRRRNNTAALKVLLAPLAERGGLRPLSPSPEEGCLYFPILLENRDAVQRYMAQRRIYCPVIWPLPEQVRGLCPVTEHVAAHMLALPCDQRYSEADMELIVHCLAEALEQ